MESKKKIYNKKCKFCSREFRACKSNQKFCSAYCRSKNWETNWEGIKFICKYCGNEFYKKHRLNALKKRWEYCSRPCANKATGKLRIKQKTRRSDNGYISIYCPDHPKSYGGRVREHILVMEKKINRFLLPGEIVHHKNYIEDDNRPENLYLVSGHSEHGTMHRKTRFLLKEFIREKGLQKEIQEYMDKHYFNKVNADPKRKGQT